MKSYPFKKAIFIKTAMESHQYPKAVNKDGVSIPEIAVVGRSNVGKSSLLNHLFNDKTLVKTSSTPGKTQGLNFFIVDDQISFVDLPGYGYAKVPVEIKREWQPMIENYLRERKGLEIILFLFDIRRDPNDEDRELINWIAQNEKAMILVLTKVDKVTKQESLIRTKKIIESFHAGNIHYVHYSSTKNIGRLPLIHMLRDALTDKI